MDFFKSVSPGEAGVGSRGIAFHTRFLVFIVAAPLLLLTIGLLLWSAALSRQAADRGLKDNARVLALSVEQEIATWATALNALAASPDLSCDPSQRFYEYAKTVATQQGGSVSLADATGVQLMNTLRPWGTVLPTAPGPTWMSEAMEPGGQPLVSDLVVDPFSGGPVLFISIPVGPASDPQCWLRMAFGPEHLSELLAPPGGGSRWTNILTDGRQSVVAASGRMSDARGTQAPRPYAAATAGEVPDMANVSWYDHVPLRVAYQHVNAGRWTLVVAAPRAALNAVWIWPVAAGVVGALLTIAVALTVSAGYASRIKRELEGLVGQAASVGEDAPPAPPPRRGVRELAVLRKALARADDDVRQRRIEHEMRMAAEAQRIAAERASNSKDLFLATLSHELRGPLTAVIGWLDMASVSLGDEAMLGNALRIAMRNAKLQAEIIEDLLDASRILSGKFSVQRQPIDLGRLCLEAVDAWRPAAAEKAVELRFTVHEPALLYGDRQRMLQMLGNLIGNAIKFNRIGGWVHLTLEERGPQLRLTVADSGCGIAPEALPHVFDRFWQADEGSSRRHFGLGLGLSLVQHIVERHDGCIRVESEGRGCGARFTAELPALAVASPPRQQSPPAPRASGLSGLVVVAVDDNADTLGWLEALLTHQGAIAWCARSADEALALLDRVQPDLLISDLAMPARDGYSLIGRIRERHGATRITALAFSGQATQEARARALISGYDGFVAKPCNADTLVAALTSLAARRAELGT